MLVVFSCNNHWGEYGGYALTYESKVHYYVTLEKGNEVSGTNLDEYKKRGTLIKYIRYSGKIDSVWLARGSKVIESYVDGDKSNFDDKFVLIAQKPLANICECNYSCLSKRESNINNIPTAKLCEDKLNRSLFYLYWIIDKSNDIVYGPLTKDKYNEVRIEIGVPNSLQLND